VDASNADALVVDRTRTDGFGEVAREPVRPCHRVEMTLDPVTSNPDHYKVILENDQVRVLEYTDQPGDRTTPHRHPDSVMYTLSTFRRRLMSGDASRDVEMSAGSVNWLGAQEHHGENIGDTPTHVIFVELKGAESARPASQLGPRSE